MNIIKEYIKVCMVNPKWRNTLKNIRKNEEKKIILIGTPAHGNLGDHAIAEEEKNYIKEFFKDYDLYEIVMPFYNVYKNRLKRIIKQNDIIAISGGGWMGNLWLHNEITIRNIIQNYPDNKIIIFPQTIFYTDDNRGKEECNITSKYISKHNNLTICLREEKSYELAKEKYIFNGNSKPILCPDIVLFGSCNYKYRPLKEKKGIIICLRKDCEKAVINRSELIKNISKYGKIKEITTVVPNLVPLKNRKKELDKLWDEFAKAKITITDRLHAMLFSVLNGTPCIVLNNKTGKVFGVLKWIESSNMVISAVNEEEVLKNIPNALLIKENKYNKKLLEMEFNKMAKELKREVENDEN